MRYGFDGVCMGVPNAVRLLALGFDAGFTGLLFESDGDNGVTFGSGDALRNQFNGLNGLKVPAFPLPAFGGVSAVAYEFSSAVDEFCVPAAAGDDSASVFCDDKSARDGFHVLVTAGCVRCGVNARYAR